MEYTVHSLAAQAKVDICETTEAIFQQRGSRRSRVEVESRFVVVVVASGGSGCMLQVNSTTSSATVGSQSMTIHAGSRLLSMPVHDQCELVLDGLETSCCLVAAGEHVSDWTALILPATCSSIQQSRLLPPTDTAL